MHYQNKFHTRFRLPYPNYLELEESTAVSKYVHRVFFHVFTARGKSMPEYVRVCQSHKRAPKVPVVDLDEAQREWGTRRKLRGIYLLKVLKWDKNWSKCSFVPRVRVTSYLLLSYDSYIRAHSASKLDHFYSSIRYSYSIQLLLLAGRAISCSLW